LGVWGVVLVVCVCVGVSVSGVLFSVGVCVCDLLIFLHEVHEHGNDSVDYRAAEPDSRIAGLRHPVGLFCHSTACNGRILSIVAGEIIRRIKINWRNEKSAGAPRSGNRAQRLCEKGVIVPPDPYPLD